jgi:hypothetical protein
MLPSVMWPTIERTRRLLLRRPSPSEPSVLGVVDGPDRDDATVEVLFSIGRAGFERPGTAIQTLLGPGTARPDTPARLETALVDVIERFGGQGYPRVTRRPAGVYTPETWHIRLTDVDPAVQATVRAAIRDGAFPR